ncbi:inhibitor of apoptosis-promoting Bax1-domain-containing protein [Diaporthe sp. PMI_573]|nr:inhibitor of apoptosis-promoting Bax1-domain-containing protein [Diaporthaceae sp. PMI_573]
MLAISAVSSIGLFSTAYKEWMQGHLALVFISIGAISMVGLAFKKRHSSATTLLIALGFTILETFTISAVSSMFKTSIILNAVTAGIFVFITAFACITKYDFTSWLPYLFGGLLGLILFGFIAAFYPGSSIKELIYGGI